MPVAPSPAHVRPLTLAFDDAELERAFRVANRRKTLPAVRLSLKVHELGTLDALIGTADGAMYAAKHAGRNVVALA